MFVGRRIQLYVPAGVFFVVFFNAHRGGRV